MLKIAVCMMLMVSAVLSATIPADDFSWDKVPDVANTSQCFFRAASQILSCRGANSSIVDCPALIETPDIGSRRIEVFGLSRIAGADAERIEQTRYRLFPRELDNISYMNSSIETTEGKPVDIFLYWGEKSVGNGMRIADRKCYARLVELFRETKMTHEVRLTDELAVQLFGEILVVDKQIQKRAGGGGRGGIGGGAGGRGGFGGGFGRGFGFGGFGLGLWGFPFWGMGMGMGMPFMGK